MLSPNGLGNVEDSLSYGLQREEASCGWSGSALRALERVKFELLYPRGAVLFMEGQAPRGIFVVRKGQVKLFVCAGSGKTFMFKIAEPGELLGLGATISGEPHELTAETLTPCQADFVRREDFLRFLREHSDACIKVTEQLGRNYHDACDEVRDLGLSQSVGERLCKLLLRWSHQNGESNKSELVVRLPVTQDEIAQMIGCCRESVTWLFADLKRRGIAECKRSVLLIHNNGALQALAENKLDQLRMTTEKRPMIKRCSGAPSCGQKRVRLPS